MPLHCRARTNVGRPPDSGRAPAGSSNDGPLLFVYGTLKRGEDGRGLLGRLRTVATAVVLGRLWLHADGYPVLEVPRQTILAEARPPRPYDLAMTRPAAQHGPPRSRGPWRPVRGEIVMLDDAARRLAALDRYEDCRPGAASAYRRVIVPVWPTRGAALAPPAAASALPAWVYVRGPRTSPASLLALDASSWSAAMARRSGSIGPAPPTTRKNRHQASCRRSRGKIK